MRLRPAMSSTRWHDVELGAGFRARRPLRYLKKLLARQLSMVQHRPVRPSSGRTGMAKGWSRFVIAGFLVCPTDAIQSRFELRCKALRVAGHVVIAHHARPRLLANFQPLVW